MYIEIRGDKIDEPLMDDPKGFLFIGHAAHATCEFCDRLLMDDEVRWFNSEPDGEPAVACQQCYNVEMERRGGESMVRLEGLSQHLRCPIAICAAPMQVYVVTWGEWPWVRGGGRMVEIEMACSVHKSRIQVDGVTFDELGVLSTTEGEGEK